MSWRAILGKLLKVGARRPVPAEPAFADPFNYALASLLQGRQRVPAELLAAVQQQFPAVTPAEYAAIHRQLEAAFTLAADLASAVNKQQLTQDAAGERLRQAFPQAARASLGSLLFRSLVDTR